MDQSNHIILDDLMLLELKSELQNMAGHTDVSDEGWNVFLKHQHRAVDVQSDLVLGLLQHFPQQGVFVVDDAYMFLSKRFLLWEVHYKIDDFSSRYFDFSTTSLKTPEHYPLDDNDEPSERLTRLYCKALDQLEQVPVRLRVLLVLLSKIRNVRSFLNPSIFNNPSCCFELVDNVSVVDTLLLLNNFVLDDTVWVVLFNALRDWRSEVCTTYDFVSAVVSAAGSEEKGVLR